MKSLNYSLFEIFLADFCEHHSIKFAVVKETNDLLIRSDKGLLSVLVLPDLSAAFDTVDHQVLIDGQDTLTGIKCAA